MADILTSEEGIEAPRMGGAGFGSANAATAAQVRKNTRYEELFSAKAKTLVKGVGHVTNGGVPLQDVSHGTEIMQRSRDAILTTKASTLASADPQSRDSVIEGIRPEFWDHPRAGGMKFMAKNFTATNMGATGAPYGLVPFDLLAPSRLIYPVYTLFRNKFPRPAGQGASRQVYGLLGISGSQTGGQGVIDISLPELVQSGQTGITSTWPLNIPGSGSQTQYRLNVPSMN